jgi:hypothetical protein
VNHADVQTQEEADTIEIEDQEYTAWVKFKPRTAIVQRTISKFGDEPLEVIATTTLLEITPEHVITESVIVTKQRGEEKSETKKRTIARRVRVPAGTTPSDVRGKGLGTMQAATEDITVAGTTYKARRFDYETIEDDIFRHTGSVWIAEEFPLGLKKVATFTKIRGPAPVPPIPVKMEVIEVKQP